MNTDSDRIAIYREWAKAVKDNPARFRIVHTFDDEKFSPALFYINKKTGSESCIGIMPPWFFDEKQSLPGSDTIDRFNDLRRTLNNGGIHAIQS